MKIQYCPKCAGEMLKRNVNVNDDILSERLNAIYKILQTAEVTALLKESIDARTMANYLSHLAAAVDNGFENGLIPIKSTKE